MGNTSPFITNHQPCPKWHENAMLFSPTEIGEGNFQVFTQFIEVQIPVHQWLCQEGNIFHRVEDPSVQIY